jgi:Zn-dependent protease with chaperone function
LVSILLGTYFVVAGLGLLVVVVFDYHPGTSAAFLFLIGIGWLFERTADDGPVHLTLLLVALSLVLLFFAQTVRSAYSRRQEGSG